MLLKEHLTRYISPQQFREALDEIKEYREELKYALDAFNSRHNVTQKEFNVLYDDLQYWIYQTEKKIRELKEKSGYNENRAFWRNYGYNKKKSKELAWEAEKEEIINETNRRNFSKVGFLGDVIPGTNSELQKSMKAARETLLEADNIISINDEIFKRQDGYIEVSPELKDILNFDNEVLGSKKQINQALRTLKGLDNGFLKIQYKDLAVKGQVGGGTLKDLIRWVNDVVVWAEDGKPNNEKSAYIITLLMLAQGKKVRWDNELNGAYDIIKKGLAEAVSPYRHTVNESLETRKRLKDKQKKYWTTAAYGAQHPTPDEWAENMIPYDADLSLSLDIRNGVLEALYRFGSSKAALQELIDMMKASITETYEWREQKYYNDLEREQNPEGFYYTGNNYQEKYGELQPNSEAPF